MIDTELADFLNSDPTFQEKCPGGAWLGAIPEAKANNLPALAYTQLSGQRAETMTEYPAVNAVWQFVVVSNGDSALAARLALKAAIARLTYYSGELTPGGTEVEVGCPNDERGPDYDAETDKFTCSSEIPFSYSDEPNLNT